MLGTEGSGFSLGCDSHVPLQDDVYWPGARADIAALLLRVSGPGKAKAKGDSEPRSCRGGLRPECGSSCPNLTCSASPRSAGLGSSPHDAPRGRGDPARESRMRKRECRRMPPLDDSGWARSVKAPSQGSVIALLISKYEKLYRRNKAIHYEIEMKREN